MGTFIVILMFLVSDNINCSSIVRTSSPSAWIRHTRTHTPNTKHQRSSLSQSEIHLDNKQIEISSKIQSQDQLMLPSDNHDHVYLSVVPPPNVNAIQYYVNKTITSNAEEDKNYKTN